MGYSSNSTPKWIFLEAVIQSQFSTLRTNIGVFLGFRYEVKSFAYPPSSRSQTVLRGVVAPCYQHHHSLRKLVTFAGAVL